MWRHAGDDQRCLHSEERCWFFFIHTGKVIEKRKQSVLVSVYVSHKINQAQVDQAHYYTKKGAGEKKPLADGECLLHTEDSV